MRSFSKSKKHGNLCRAAAFAMTFLLMFTTVAPNASMFGGAGRTADAATADGNTYKVLTIMAEYNQDQWATARNGVWKPAIENRLKGILGNGIKVNMDTFVHTREFNCHKEDIVDNYDYVVIIVNEPFSHVGGTRSYGEEQMKISGSTYTAEKTSVTSGNDITARKLKELELFYDCGYPIEFMSLDHLKDTASTREWLGSSSSNDDDETNIATLYEYMKKNNDNVPVHIDGTHSQKANKRINDIRSGRVNLEITGSPVDYNVGYANTGEETSKLLNYTFKISDGASDASSKTYTANFYLDMNNDGRFDKELESLSYLGITLASNSKRSIESNALKANTEYRLTVNASKYVGLVNWKLVVSDNSDSEHRFSYKDGACKLHRMKGQEKEKLRILQLTASPSPTSESSSWTYNTVYLPTRAEAEWMKANGITRDNITTKVNASIEDKSLFKTDQTATDSYIYNVSKPDWQNRHVNFKDDILRNMYDFYKYLYSDQSAEGVSDYDIYIDRVYVNKIDEVAWAANPESTKNYETLYQYLTDNYDMLIIGFSDCYDDVKSVVCDAIQAFIAEGKSVLFTHDTSSFVNTWKTWFSNKENNNNWGYNINQKLRNLLGMDRFGVSLTVAERKEQNKDYYHNKYSQYIQGYADSTIEASVDNTNWSTGGQNGTYNTKKASRVNTGPITEYPYKIGVAANGSRSDEISIAQTHTQYYQLDLESEDIVVWYALSGICGGKRYNDGRNNYYIYNKGNITYSGVGDWEGLSDDEVKLFANTMIAAYRAGDSAVTIESTDWDASTTETEAGNRIYDYVTLPVDYIKKVVGGAFGESIVNNKSGADTTQYRRVKFKIYDRTVAANKKVTIDFYTASSKSDTQTEKKLDYYAKSIYRMSDGKVVVKNGSVVDGQKLESGTEYYIYVPLSSFNEKQIFRGDITATIRPSGQSNPIVIKNSVYVNFNNRLQFNLS